MTITVLSRNEIPIRLTGERWSHIVEEHSEMAGLREEVLQTISDAERIVAGNAGELLAVRLVEAGKAIVVVYREVSLEDGFVITAFLTRRLASLDRRKQIWPQLT